MLYLVRHAHALDADVDETRPLSDKGRRQIMALARFVRWPDQHEAVKAFRSWLRNED